MESVTFAPELPAERKIVCIARYILDHAPNEVAGRNVLRQIRRANSADQLTKVAQWDRQADKCPHCGKDDGNIVKQPNGTLMCIDCYWEESESV